MTAKIISVEEMIVFREQFASQGRKVVFTNGCFDLLHVGHVRYLKEAKQQGDLLVVGLNDDESTRYIKGPGRPLMAQEDRAEILAALEYVNYVIIFSERTAERLVGTLKPDIYVKGGNYKVEELPEAAVVVGYGGQVYLTSVTPGRSTTSLIAAVLAYYGRNGG